MELLQYQEQMLMNKYKTNDVGSVTQYLTKYNTIYCVLNYLLQEQFSLFLQ
jgi:hypothetical protein